MSLHAYEDAREQCSTFPTIWAWAKGRITPVQQVIVTVLKMG